MYKINPSYLNRLNILLIMNHWLVLQSVIGYRITDAIDIAILLVYKLLRAIKKSKKNLKLFYL